MNFTPFELTFKFVDTTRITASVTTVISVTGAAGIIFTVIG